MLPPIESTVLSNNPQFSQLYKKLTSSILNSDGSIRVSSREKEARASIEEDLLSAQTQAAKTQLIRSTLPRVSYGDNELSNKLQEIIEIIAAQLTTQLSASERDLLSDDLAYFLNHLLPVGEALSSELSQIAFRLKGIAYPQEAHRNLLIKIPDLPLLIGTRRKELVVAQETLSNSRLELAVAASKVLETYREVVETTIRALEQTKYGSVARGIKAQTEHLAIVAESMDAKLQVMNLEALNEIYTPEVRTSLARYKEHLEDTGVKFKEREELAKRRLQKYESAGTGMEEIAKRFAELTKEADSVRVDIKRLGGEVQQIN